MNKPMLPPLPVKFDSDAIAANERRAILRAITAQAIAAIRSSDPIAMLKAAWPDDRAAVEVLRAVSNPLTTSGYPVQNLIGLFRSIAPKSAALELFNMGRSLDLTGINQISIPRASGLPVATPFVAEGAPGPVLQTPTASFVVGPTKKILVLAAVTRELDQATPQGAVNIVATILGDAIARSLDAVVFGTGAATSAQPAGLLNGVTPLTASSSTRIDAMVDDVGNLIEAIGDAGIDVNQSVLVGGPKEVAALMMFPGAHFWDMPVLSTVALKGSLACFAAPAIASAYADVPQVETSRESLLHYNTTPATDPLTAGPTLSAFQNELINIKVRGRAAWAVHPGGAQVINTISW